MTGANGPSMKCLCTTSSILAYADFPKLFKLHIDACGSCLGAVLYQVPWQWDWCHHLLCQQEFDQGWNPLPYHKLDFLVLKWAVVKKSSMSTSMGWLLIFILTIIYWHTFWLEQSWMLWVTAGWPVWPIITFNYITGWGRLTSMQMPCQGCPGQGMCPGCQTHTIQSLQWQCELCRRPPLRAPQVALRHTAVTCMSWTQ